jgi:hypothetical protein
MQQIPNACKVHNKHYEYPRCHKCFACKHQRTEDYWWICPDGSIIRVHANGTIMVRLDKKDL